MGFRSCIGSALMLACCLLPAIGQAQKGSGGRSVSVPRVSGVDPWGRSNSGLFTPSPPLPDVVTARHAEDDKKVDFKSETVMVLVPAAVTDKSGNPLRNLTQADFRILENGRLQKIASFEEVTASNARLAPAGVPGEYSNLLAGSQEPQAVTVIALDTINTPYLDQRYGREQLLKYLAQHLPSQPVALVLITSRGLEVAQDFTDDPQHLLQVLKKVTGGMPLTQGDDLMPLAEALDINYAPLQSANASGLLQGFLVSGDANVVSFHQGNAVATTMQAFLDLAWALSGIRGHKSVIWLTGSFPFVLDSPSAVPGGDLALVYERTFHELNRANVSLYPVDVRGLVNPMIDVSSAAQPGRAVIGARDWLHVSTLESLSMVASMTGGRAFFNTNDLAAAFQRAMQDSSSYYMLGYYLDTSDRRPGWRELKVSVDRNGAEVHARRGFFVTNATVNPPLTRDIDLGYALACPFDVTGLPLEVRFLGETGKGKTKDLAFHIHIPPNGMTMGNENQFDMDFIAMAATPKAQLSAHLAQNLRGRVPAAEMANVRATGFGFAKKLALAPGRYLLRFVVRDNLSGNVGSVSAPIVIN